MSAVAHQQLHANAAEAILRRFQALYPKGKFPKPEQLLDTEEAAMRGAGFSLGKIKAIRDIAEKRVSGLIPSRARALKLSDEELITRLVEVRGVGRWTVEMLLMFTLGRLDVLPATDYGVRNGFALIYGLKELPAPKEILAHGERWRPYRSVASWYMWRAVDLAKEKAK